MKTIKIGEIPKAPAPGWWAGQVLTCGYCGTQVEIEHSDIGARGVMIVKARSPEGDGEIRTDCPTCGESITKIVPGLKLKAVRPGQAMAADDFTRERLGS